jgi:hypothetical protein
MRNTYERTANCIKTNKWWSGWFETRLGVMQRSVLSPLLFNMIISNICNKIREMKVTDLKTFIYAGDIRIWDDDVKELETRLA